MQVDAADAPRRRSDAQRNLGAILVAGAQVLAQNPRASIQEVAVAAGVHRATVHRHFASRDALVHAVRAMVLDDFLDLVCRHATADGPPALRLAELTRDAIEHGDRYRIHRVAASFDELTDARAEDYGRTLASLIAPARDEGFLRRDASVEDLVAGWGGLLLVALSRLGRGAFTVDEAVDFVLRMLRPSAPPDS